MTYGTGTYGTGQYGAAAEAGFVFRAIPEPDSSPPRVRLYVDTGSDDVTIREMTITRDGQPIRAEVPVGGRRLVTFDYEAPYGVPLTYEVEGVALDAPVEAPFSMTAMTTLDSPCAWLVHPVVSMSVCIDAYRWRDDALNLQGTSAKTFSRPARMSRFDPPGRSRAVFFRHGPRQISEWEMTLFAPTADSLDALDAALRGQSPMLLRIPPSWRLDLPDDWYQIGDTSAERATDVLRYHERRVTLGMTPTIAPPLVAAMPWTYADVADAFETYADLVVEYESYAELGVGGW